MTKAVEKKKDIGEYVRSVVYSERNIGWRDEDKSWWLRSSHSQLHAMFQPEL